MQTPVILETTAGAKDAPMSGVFRLSLSQPGVLGAFSPGAVVGEGGGLFFLSASGACATLTAGATRCKVWYLLHTVKKCVLRLAEMHPSV